MSCHVFLASCDIFIRILLVYNQALTQYQNSKVIQKLMKNGNMSLVTVACTTSVSKTFVQIFISRRHFFLVVNWLHLYLCIRIHFELFKCHTSNICKSLHHNVAIRQIQVTYFYSLFSKKWMHGKYMYYHFLHHKFRQIF